MVQLADDRLNFWHQLREVAGLDVPERVHDDVEAELEAELDGQLEALRAEYEQKIIELKSTYPRIVARRMAEGLIGFKEGGATVADILNDAAAAGLAPLAAGQGPLVADVHARPVPWFRGLGDLPGIPASPEGAAPALIPGLGRLALGVIKVRGHRDHHDHEYRYGSDPTGP